MYIPDPAEILERQIELQIDLVDIDNTYPCYYCKRKFPADEMHPISAHPAAPLECGMPDCEKESEYIKDHGHFLAEKRRIE